ncbi:MAG TPA: hypothetical protein VL326_03095 [Kofleriaceae bacterium]|jgi:tetratricopeptide (TPR) repeat protein|nr:hypothetical protein [Kofleriaceae bacterium]
MSPRIAAVLLTSLAFAAVANADTPPAGNDPFGSRNEGDPPAQPSSPAQAPTPTPAPEPPPPPKKPTKQAKAEAKKHIAEGTKLYNVQQFGPAADEYTAAYVLDPVPEYLYAAAQAWRQGGDCEKALISYRNYLRTNPKARDQDKAQKNIDRCEQDLRDKQAAIDAAAQKIVKEKEEAAAREAAKVAADAAAAKAAKEAIEAKRRADEAAAKRAEEEQKAAAAKRRANAKSYIPGHVMLGVGVLAVGGGVFLFRDGHNAINDYNAITNYDEFLAAKADADAAKTRQMIGIATIGAGVGLIAGATVFYVLHSRKTEAQPAPTTPTVSATIGPDHAGLVVLGSF